MRPVAAVVGRAYSIIRVISFATKKLNRINGPISVQKSWIVLKNSLVVMSVED
jgi:hypothetical protein